MALLAPTVDPNLCAVVAGASDIDLQLFVEGSYAHVDWRPQLDSLRGIGLDERRRRLRIELLRRVLAPNSGWRLVWLPDDPTQPPVPFNTEQLGELTPENFLVTRAHFDDPEISGIRLGGQVHRARIEEVPAETKKDRGHPPRLDVKERMRVDLKQQSDGTWKLVDENGRVIAQKNWSERYRAAPATCAKYLAELVSEIKNQSRE